MLLGTIKAAIVKANIPVSGLQINADSLFSRIDYLLLPPGEELLPEEPDRPDDGVLYEGELLDGGASKRGVRSERCGAEERLSFPGLDE